MLVCQDYLSCFLFMDDIRKGTSSQWERKKKKGKKSYLRGIVLYIVFFCSVSTTELVKTIFPKNKKMLNVPAGVASICCVRARATPRRPFEWMRCWPPPRLERVSLETEKGVFWGGWVSIHERQRPSRHFIEHEQCPGLSSRAKQLKRK